MNRRIEVLAPAGNFDSLKAAVFSGADAVYLAGESFGARASAKNFTDGELEEAVKFCRIRDVKVYVTVNTLIKECEFEKALDFIKFLCRLHADAVIIQDLGLFKWIRGNAPDLTVHTSTQMSILGSQGANLVHEMGATRVVLPRELSFKEIASVAQKTDAELEVFVHGALCMCVSGQCYFSSALGDRSGNRGKCAQPCRLHFSAGKGNERSLSLKDLSIIDDITKLEKAGVTSAKIEGRMKRPEYVAAAVSSCLKALEGTFTQDEHKKLETVFSRSGFTKGYFENKRDNNMFGIRRKEDAIESKKIMPQMKELYRRERQCVPVTVVLEEGSSGVKLTAGDDRGNKVEILKETGIVDKMADNDYTDGKRCISQLGKMGGTPFFADEVIAPEDGVKLKVSDINLLRRQALESLSTKRSQSDPIFVKDDSLYNKDLKHPDGVKKQLNLRASFMDVSQIPDDVGIFEKIYLPGDICLDDRVKGAGDKLIFEIPRGVFEGAGAAYAEKVIVDKKSQGYNEFSCYSLDAVQMCIKYNVKFHTMFSLNVMNNSSLEFLSDLGASSAELSFELAADEIKKIDAYGIEKGIMIYGRQPLMFVRNCPVKGNFKCDRNNCSKALTDRKGVKFPVACSGKGDNFFSQIYNSVPLCIDMIEAGRTGVDFALLRFTVENHVETEQVIHNITAGINACPSYTKGQFKRGVD